MQKTRETGLAGLISGKIKMVTQGESNPRCQIESLVNASRIYIINKAIQELMILLTAVLTGAAVLTPHWLM